MSCSQKFLQNPQLVQAAVDKDANLQVLLASNPVLASLLDPEKIQRTLQAVSQPELLLSGQMGLMPSVDGDLSKHRMTVLQLQQYSQQMQQQKLAQQGATGSSVPTSSVTPPASFPMAPTMPADPQAMMANSMARLQTSLARLQQTRANQAASSSRDNNQSNTLSSSISTHGPAFASHQPQHYTPHFAHLHAQQQQPQGPAARAMHAPMQQAPLFSGHQAEGEADYQGTFSFSHAEREVPVEELPTGVQAHLMEVLMKEHAHAAQAQGGGGAAVTFTDSMGGGNGGALPVSTAPESFQAHGKSVAEQKYLALYTEFMEKVAHYEQGGGKARGEPAPNATPLWAAYHEAYGVGQANGGATGAVGGAGMRQSARDYYEPVSPSSWRPSDEDTTENIFDLYKQAYCTKVRCLLATSMAMALVCWGRVPLPALPPLRPTLQASHLCSVLNPLQDLGDSRGLIPTDTRCGLLNVYVCSLSASRACMPARVFVCALTMLLLRLTPHGHQSLFALPTWHRSTCLGRLFWCC